MDGGGGIVVEPLCSSSSRHSFHVARMLAFVSLLIPR